MGTLITILWLLATLAHAQDYQLQSYFPGATFLDNFDFYTSWDPTFGYVHYVDRATAEQHGMISYTPNTTRWGVESTEVLDPSANWGRLSVRLTSKQRWTHGLFVLDLKHMPHNSCGAWPAYWMVGSGTWPSTGEIDIVEFTNTGTSNLMAMHTMPGCSIAGANQTGQLDYDNCNQGDAYTGCAVRSKAIHGSGAQFNAIGGGIYAFEWTERWVRVWFFPRGFEPDSIAGDETTTPPDTSTFGVPVANFEGSCDLDQFLYDHMMVFNVDFCGSYAGNVFGLQGCPMTVPDNAWSSCVQYVALQPEAFTEVYWEVNFLKIYQDNSGWVPPSVSLSSVTPAASSSSVSRLSSNAQGRPTTPTMSLAGTTPSISGEFSATSSALSVLSSFSAASEASVLSSISDGSIPPPPPPTVSLHFTSPTTQPSVPAPPSSSTPSPPTMPVPSSPPGVPIVTYVTVVVVPEIVTVYVPPSAHGHAAHQHAKRQLSTGSSISTSSVSSDPGSPTVAPISINTHGNCSFVVPRTASTTDFNCTFTKLGLFEGTLYTNRITFSTEIPPETGLTLLTFLAIDTFSVQTQTLPGDALGATFTAVAGSFTPTAASLATEVLTAYPVPAEQGTAASCSSSSIQPSIDDD